MKNLLFSRSHKKYYTDAVVRMGKNNLGFSLVELIIVIAIMAVLAAIAIPVLGVYIEKAKIANDKQKVNDIFYAVNLAGQSMQYEVNVPQVSEEGLQIPVGFIILNDQGDMIILGSDDVCDANGVITTVGTNHAQIEQMMADALGTYNSKLAYDGWGNTNSIPALYGDSEALYGEVQELCDLLASDTMTAIKTAASLAGININTGDYDSGVEALAAVAEMVIAAYPNESDFVNEWSAGASVEDTFGLTGTKNGVEMKMEAYMAVRRAYNEALATYITSMTLQKGLTHTTYAYDTNGTKTESVVEDAATHANYIVNSGTELAGQKIPDVVSIGLFGESGKDGYVGRMHNHTADKCGYKTIPIVGTKVYLCGHDDNKRETKEGSLDDSVQFCEACKSLVNDYANSSEAKEDARAFYKLMRTLNDTSEEATAFGSWDYYDDLVVDFAASYENLNKIVANYENCIVVTITKGYDGLLYAECNTPGVLDE